MTGHSERIEGTPFRCAVARDGTAVRITVEGELDLASAGAVEELLRAPLEDGVERRILDLSGLTFMDSTGLRAILTAHGAARREGRSALQIVPGPPAVQRIFEICGVKDGLHFVAP